MIRRSIYIVFAVLACAFSLNVHAQSPKWKRWAVEADTLYNQQKYKEAAVIFTRIINANPLKNGKFEDRSVYGILYKRAVCYYNTQEFKKALADINLFAPAYPSASQPKLLKAFIYREMDDVDNQLINLTEAMELQDPNPDFLKWRGLLYVQQNKYPLAIADLLQSRTFQDDTEIESYLGLCYFYLERRDSAFISFNKAIELDPTFLAPYLYASSAALQDNDYGLSVEYANLALLIDGKSNEALFYKGVALIESKRVDEGCRCLNRAFYAGYDDAADYISEYCFGVEN